MDVFSKYKYADFFAGIGGFRQSLDKLGLECNFTCELDEQAVKTYNENYGTSVIANDIQKLNLDEIPDFNVFCGGFPCQPFSIAGKMEGLEDERGKLVESIFSICKAKQPEVIFLENVSNLAKLKGGSVLNWISERLEDIGYSVFHSVLNSKHFGVPQSRPRLYIVAFRKDLEINSFQFPLGDLNEVPVSKIIEKGDNSIPVSDKWEQYIDYYSGKLSEENLTFNLPKTRKKLERQDKEIDIDNCIYQMRSSGIRALSLDKPLPTLAVSISGGGAMIPVYSSERRHLSVLELKRVMGFPDQFKFPVSRTNAIKQLANAVCPAVISAIACSIQDHIEGNSQCRFNRSEIFSLVG